MVDPARVGTTAVHSPVSSFLLFPSSFFLLLTSLPPDRRKHWAYALIFITPAFWGVNYLVARAANQAVAPHMLAFWRWFFAGALMAALSWREIAAQRDAVRQEWRQFLVLGALGMWICGAFVYLGARTSPASNIGLIYALSPVLVAVFSRFALKEPIGRLQTAGTGFALAGFFHIALKGQWRDISEVQLTPGDWWILAAAIAWTAYTLLLKAWPTAFGPAARLTLTVVAGVLVLLPFAIVEALWFMPSEISLRTFGYVLLTALFPGFGAYLAYSFMLRELGPSRVALVLYLGPVYAALMGWAVLREPVHAYHWAGAALILPGIYLATRGAAERKK
jgi:drug/metabolite transporter (DMT)-like permease